MGSVGATNIRELQHDRAHHRAGDQDRGQGLPEGTARRHGQVARGPWPSPSAPREAIDAMDKVAVLDYGVAVHAADRPPHPRAGRLLRDLPAAPAPLERDPARLPGRRPLRGARRASTTRARRCPPGALLEAGPPGPRHLLRHAGHGPPPGREGRCRAPHREYGRAEVALESRGPAASRASSPDTSTGLRHGLDEPRRHRARAAAGVPSAGHHRRTARSPRWPTPERRLYAVQFHPEVAHTPQGQTRPRELPLPAARRSSRGWSMRSFVDQAVDAIRRQVGRERVLCALSGGVDSSVVAALSTGRSATSSRASSWTTASSARGRARPWCGPSRTHSGCS